MHPDMREAGVRIGASQSVGNFFPRLPQTRETLRVLAGGESGDGTAVDVDDFGRRIDAGGEATQRSTIAAHLLTTFKK